LQICEKIGKELKRLRKETGLTQKEVAERLGKKTPASVSYWESGKLTTIPALEQVLNFYGCTLAIVENDSDGLKNLRKEKIEIKKRSFHEKSVLRICWNGKEIPHKEFLRITTRILEEIARLLIICVNKTSWKLEKYKELRDRLVLIHEKKVIEKLIEAIEFEIDRITYIKEKRTKDQ